MGWDQSYSFESKNQFLARLLGLDLQEVIRKAIDNALQAKGIKVVKEESFDAADDMYAPGDSGLRITLADGRVFEHKCVQRECWDDKGHDHYEFREQGEQVVPTDINHENET